jgi:tetratricopeptide (TPR) repeat protein
MTRDRDWTGWLIIIFLAASAMTGSLSALSDGFAWSGPLLCLALLIAATDGAAKKSGRWPSLRHPALVAALVALAGLALGRGSWIGFLYHSTLALALAAPSWEGGHGHEKPSIDEITLRRTLQALFLAIFTICLALVGDVPAQGGWILAAAFLPMAVGHILACRKADTQRDNHQDNSEKKLTDQNTEPPGQNPVWWKRGDYLFGMAAMAILLAGVLVSNDRLIMVTATAALAIMAWIFKSWTPAVAACALMAAALTAPVPSHLEALLFQTDAVAASFPAGTGTGRFQAGLLEVLPGIQPWSHQKGLSSTISTGPGIPGLILVENGWMGAIVLLALLAFCVTLITRAVSSDRPAETGASLTMLAFVPLLLPSGLEQSLFFPITACLVAATRCLPASTSVDRKAPLLGIFLCLMVGAGWISEGIEQTRAKGIIDRANRIFNASISGKNYTESQKNNDLNSNSPSEPGADTSLKDRKADDETPLNHKTAGSLSTIPPRAFPAQGVILLSQGDKPGAVAMFKASDASFFTFRELMMAGKAYKESGEVEQAFNCFHSAFLLSGKSWFAGLDLARFYKSIGQTRAALDVLEAIESLNREHREILSEKATLCEALGQGARAQTILETAHDLTGDSSFLARAGQTALRMKDYPLAMDYFHRAADEGDRISSLRFIEAAVLAGETEACIAFIKKKSRDLPRTGKDLRRLQMVLNREKADSIREAISRALAANSPEIVDKLRERVSELEKIGRSEAAMGEIDHFLAEGGEDSALRLKRGDLLLKLSRNLEAADAYLEAARKIRLKDSGMSMLYRRVSQAFARARKYRTAIYYSEKALSYSGGRDPEILNDLAKTYGLADMHREAEETLLKALSINPEFQLTYYNLAMSYYKRNLSDKAIKVVESALARPPGLYTDRLKALLDHLKTFRVIKAKGTDLQQFTNEALPDPE